MWTLRNPSPKAYTNSSIAKRRPHGVNLAGCFLRFTTCAVPPPIDTHILIWLFFHSLCNNCALVLRPVCFFFIRRASLQLVLSSFLKDDYSSFFFSSFCSWWLSCQSWKYSLTFYFCFVTDATSTSGKIRRSSFSPFRFPFFVFGLWKTSCVTCIPR